MAIFSKGEHAITCFGYKYHALLTFTDTRLHGNQSDKIVNRGIDRYRKLEI